MNKLFIALLSLSVFVFACNGGDDKKEEKSKNEYQQTKETLADKEKKNPAAFLKVTGSEKHNLIGQTVVRGKITNKAVATTFKDVEVKLDFYSKTGTKLETDKETVYEIIAPGQTTSFKTKYFAPKGTDSVALSIITANYEK